MNVRRSLLGPVVALVSAGFTAFCSAGTVQMIDGTFHQGTVSIDAGLLVKGNPTVKLAFAQVLLARFTDQPTPHGYSPGLVLTNGTRIAGEFTRLGEPTIRIDQKGIRIPSEEVAWLIYEPLPPSISASVPGGKTGALLRGGDFFEGTLKAGDAKGARVVNSIFGPRTFSAGDKALHALVMRRITPQPSVFAVLTRDGSRYLANDIVVHDTVGITLKHPHYDGLQIAAADLVEIRAMPHRLIVLGERAPAEPPGKEAAPIPALPGPRIHLKAGTSLTWRLPTSGGTLVARISPAKSEDAPKKITFVVMADDRVLFRTPPVDPQTATQVLRCPVPAANAITIRVEGEAGAGLWEDPVIIVR